VSLNVNLAFDCPKIMASWPPAWMAGLGAVCSETESVFLRGTIASAPTSAGRFQFSPWRAKVTLEPSQSLPAAMTRNFSSIVTMSEPT
jgi:hypothetical protein